MPDHPRADPNCSTATAREVVGRFVDLLLGEVGVDASMLDGVEVWVAGDAWWSGTLSPERAADVQRRFHACFRGGAAAIRTVVRAIAMDRDRAFIELEQSGPWYDGREYRCPLVIALDLEEERVVRLRQYMVDREFFGREPEPDAFSLRNNPR